MRAPPRQAVVVDADSFWHGLAMRVWTTLTLMAAATLLGGGSCGDGFTCECFPCGAAISVFVVDADGAAFGGDWTIEASLNGEAVDASACDPAARVGANTCGIGFETGTYQMVLRTPTAEKSFTARFAGRAGQDCCNCLLGDTVQIEIP